MSEEVREIVEVFSNFSPVEMFFVLGVVAFVLACEGKSR